MATTDGRLRRLIGLATRVALPGAILAGGWAAFLLLSEDVEKDAVPPTETKLQRTKVVKLETRDYPVVIKTYGVVQAQNQVTLTSEVSGVITFISPSFEVGAYFDKSEKLVEIDKRNYNAALSMAESRVLSARSALKLAELNEQRKLRLVESNAVSQADVYAATASREQAEADVDSAAAQLQQAKLDLQRATILAPFDGRVQAKNVGLGQMAGPNTPLGEIFAVDFAEVRLPISGRQRQFLTLPEFADDPAVPVKLRDAISKASPAEWDAAIVRTEGVLDEDSRDLFAIARINDPFGRESEDSPLHIAQPVVASIRGKVLRNVIALPRGAVRQLNQIVLVDAEEHTLTPLEVDPIWSDAAHVIVAQSEIPPGQLLATTHMVYAPAGSKVEIIPDGQRQPAIADSGSGNAVGAAAQ